MPTRLLEDTFTQTSSQALTERLTTDASDFSELVEAFGLDPRHDFRHSDLTGADFSGSNLAGFDFTGADLRGSFGINTSVEGAILTDAQTTGSLFEYQTLREKFLKGNSQAQRMLRTLSNEHWTNATLWVADQVVKRRHADAIEVTKALFLETKDTVLRNQILFFLARTFDDRPAYLAFLLATQASHGDNKAIHRSVVSLMSQLFYNHRAVYEIMLREIKSGDLSDPRSALAAIAKSSFCRFDFDSVLTLVRDRVDDVNRRYFIRAFVKALGGKFSVLLHDGSLAQTLDYEASIPDKTIRYAARSSVGRTAVKTRTLSLDEDEREVGKRASLIRRRLDDLSTLGLKLKIEQAPLRRKVEEKSASDNLFRVPEGRRILEAGEGQVSDA